jgi:AcrR family transcriptional regulator
MVDLPLSGFLFIFMLTPLTLFRNVSCVNIDFMSGDSAYHHGDLRAALMRAAAEEIEQGGYEHLSLRELAASLGVSRGAPYRHFVDRRALLTALAAEGFDALTAVYQTAVARAKTPQARLHASGRAYFAFAAERPQLFRLMFTSDLLVSGPRDPTLIAAANTCYEVFESLVAATLGDPDDRAVKAAAIATMSCAYGFALLRIGERLKPFMIGRLTQDELVDAVLSMRVTALPRAAARRRRSKS